MNDNTQVECAWCGDPCGVNFGGDDQGDCGECELDEGAVEDSEGRIFCSQDCSDLYSEDEE